MDPRIRIHTKMSWIRNTDKNISLSEFPQLMEADGEVICRTCHLTVSWAKASNIKDHLKSKKHLRALQILSTGYSGVVEELTDVQK
jgi:hypothetical protein